MEKGGDNLMAVFAFFKKLSLMATQAECFPRFFHHQKIFFVAVYFMAGRAGHFPGPVKFKLRRKRERRFQIIRVRHDCSYLRMASHAKPVHIAHKQHLLAFPGCVEMALTTFPVKTVYAVPAPGKRRQ
jgi:hypothetical protein